MSHRIILEVAVTTPDEAAAAVAAGADRLELCSALEVGGVTPWVELDGIGWVDEEFPAYLLLRPRPGGFVYTPQEWLAVRSQAEVYLQGDRVGGVVSGVLAKPGMIHRGRCRELVKLANGRAVFHRAFDFLPDPFAALEELIDLGFERVLTSGGAPTALEGAEVIAKLIKQAAGRIEILPGGGVTPENVEELVRRTGCDQVHGSFRSPVHDPTLAANPALAAGMGGGMALDPAKVAATRAVLDRLAAG
jgi:copper homeostasis protein